MAFGFPIFKHVESIIHTDVKLRRPIDVFTRNVELIEQPVAEHMHTTLQVITNSSLKRKQYDERSLLMAMLTSICIRRRVIGQRCLRSSAAKLMRFICPAKLTSLLSASVCECRNSALLPRIIKDN